VAHSFGSTLSQSFVRAQKKLPPFGLALSISSIFHVVLLLLWFEFVHTTRIVLVTDVIVAASPVAHEEVVFQPQASSGAALLPMHRRIRRMHKAVPSNPNVGTSDSSAMETLRTDAQRTTASLMKELKFRLNYGIGSKDYELPIHKEGEIPLISAADLPPRFEQYLEIEILIDTTGSVAQAKVVHGAADQKIEDRLLAAVRQFKYVPAKYLQRPVPCQMDIVIHIPS
jgi:Gram-negative bacterial TonB protein C-terminal